MVRPPRAGDWYQRHVSLPLGVGRASAWPYAPGMPRAYSERTVPGVGQIGWKRVANTIAATMARAERPNKRRYEAVFRTQPPKIGAKACMPRIVSPRPM